MYTIDTTQKSDTYIARPGAAEADRAYFLTAPRWREKLPGVARQGSVFPTVGGGASIQSFPRLTIGTPVTLDGDDRHGLMFDTEVAKLAAMFAEGTELEFSDDAGTTKYGVYPDWSQDRPINMDYLDGYYRKVLRGSVYLVRA